MIETLIDNSRLDHDFDKDCFDVLLGAKVIFADAQETVTTEKSIQTSKTPFVSFDTLARQKLANAYLLIEKPSWSFVEFMQSPISQNLQFMFFITGCQGEVFIPKLEDWWNAGIATDGIDFQTRVICYSGIFRVAYDTINLKLACNPTMVTLEDLILQTQTVANMIRALRLNQFSNFNKWLKITESLIGELSAKNIRDRITALIPVGARPFTLNYTSEEWTSGQLFKASLRGKNTNITTRPELKGLEQSFTEILDRLDSNQNRIPQVIQVLNKSLNSKNQNPQKRARNPKDVFSSDEDSGLVIDESRRTPPKRKLSRKTKTPFESEDSLDELLAEISD